MLAAVVRANIWLLVIVVMLGAVVQLTRAQRVTWLLAQDRGVKVTHTYNALVVGHGIGDLVPVVPGGLALRCTLTKHLSRIPVAFSAGVFMLEGMLDGLGLSIVIVYLLLAATMTTGIRWLLMAALAQLALFLLVPCFARALSTWERRHSTYSKRLAGLRRLAGQMTAGLGTLTARGPRVIACVLGPSLLVTALEAVQMLLFLRAFALTAPVNRILLILVLMLAANSIPVKIPGAGTVVATGVMALAGIHGPGLAGYVLISRLVATSETTLLALAVLGCWSVTRRRHHDPDAAVSRSGLSERILDRECA